MFRKIKKLLALITALATIGFITGCSNQPVADTQNVTVYLEWDNTAQTQSGTVEYVESQTNGFKNKISVEVSDIVGDNDATTNAIKQALGLE